MWQKTMSGRPMAQQELGSQALRFQKSESIRCRFLGHPWSPVSLLCIATRVTPQKAYIRLVKYFWVYIKRLNLDYESLRTFLSSSYISSAVLTVKNKALVFI